MPAHAVHRSLALPVSTLSEAMPVLSPGMYSDQQRRKARREAAKAQEPQPRVKTATEMRQASRLYRERHPDEHRAYQREYMRQFRAHGAKGAA
jgi:hypothetical protein